MTLVEIIDFACEKYPKKTAIAYHDTHHSKTVTYKDFCYGSNLVKERLNILKKKRQVPVGIFMDNHFCVPSIILGIMKSSCTFVCFDTNAQIEWNRHLIQALRITDIITLSSYFDKITTLTETMSLHDEYELLGETLQRWRTGVTTGKVPYCSLQMMYVVQTSGSTGKPKIVRVHEHCILSNIINLRNEFRVDSSDIVLFSTPLTFDPSIIEIFMGLTTGATLLTVSSDVRASPDLFLKIAFPPDNIMLSPSIVQLTPSVFKRWTREEVQSRILNNDNKVKVLALGGEVCPTREEIDRYRSYSNKTTYYTLYGITEVSCWAMISFGRDGGLGDSLHETLIKVVDSHGNEVVEGEGELYIGSLTRVCLIDNESWSSLEKPIFRSTGDIVQIQDNMYKYMGRKDNIVKRFGSRISLEHTETVSLQCMGIEESCCVIDDKDRLVLFVVIDSALDESTYKKDLKFHLFNTLPNPSIPDLILSMPKLPLTKHGKVDRHILVKIAQEQLEPDTEWRKDILETFNELWIRYTCENMSEKHGFLDLGGNSISALQIVTELSAKFSRIPRDLINLLLKNCDHDRCCESLSQADVEPNLASSIVNETKANLNSDRNSEEQPLFKKFKPAEDCDINVSMIQFRGRNIMFRNREESYLRKKYHNVNVGYLKEKWKLNLGKCIDGSPVFVQYQSNQNIVTVGSHSGKVAAVNMYSGKEKFNIKLPDRIESSLYPSPCGKYGAVGCYNGNVYCICLDSGKTRWIFKTNGMVKSVPVYIGNTVIVGSYDHFVYCINGQTGELIWKHDTGGSVSSTPAYCNVQNTAVVVTPTAERSIYAFNAQTGEVRWNKTVSSPVYSSPGIVEDDANSFVIVAEVLGMVHCFSMSDGEEIWTYHSRGNIYSSVITNQMIHKTIHIIFGCHDSNVYCLRCCGHGPELKWKTYLDSPVYATPCFDDRNNYVIGVSSNGCVHVMDYNTGEIKCRFQLCGEVYSSPVIHDSHIVVGCRDNNLYCLEMIYK